MADEDLLLRDLIATHTKETAKGFLCLLCHSVIARRWHVKRHFLDRHVPANTYFVCPVCRKSYRNRSSLETHVYRYHRAQSKSIDLGLCERPRSDAEGKDN